MTVCTVVVDLPRKTKRREMHAYVPLESVALGSGMFIQQVFAQSRSRILHSTRKFTIAGTLHNEQSGTTMVVPVVASVTPLVPLLQSSFFCFDFCCFISRIQTGNSTWRRGKKKERKKCVCTGNDSQLVHSP